VAIKRARKLVDMDNDGSNSHVKIEEFSVQFPLNNVECITFHIKFAFLENQLYHIP
jgi:hypothetical protein